MTDAEIRAVFRELHPDLKVGRMEMVVARSIAAAEREACALVAESYEPRCDTCSSGVANAIRARGKR